MCCWLVLMKPLFRILSSFFAYGCVQVLLSSSKGRLMVVKGLSFRSSRVPYYRRIFGFLRQNHLRFSLRIVWWYIHLVFGRNKAREEAESEAASSLGAVMPWHAALPVPCWTVKVSSLFTLRGEAGGFLNRTISCRENAQNEQRPRHGRKLC